MAQVVWSEKAWKEYRSCLVYSEAEFGRKAAKSFFNNVTNATKRLEAFPLIGFPEPLLAGKEELFRSRIIQKNFKLIYHYSEANNIVYIDDLWDTRKEPNKLKKRI